MAIREPKKILPTMKVDIDEKKRQATDIDFVAVTAEIVKLDDVETKNYGTKTIMTLAHKDYAEGFQIFINNYSLEELNKAFGNDDANWIGKKVKLVIEEDKQYHNDMIVTKPVLK